MKHRWLRFSISIMMILMLMNLSSPTMSVRAEDSNSYLPDEVILKLTQATDLTSVASDYALDPSPLDQFGSRPIFRMQIIDGASPPARAAELSADPRVVYAEPNFIGRAPEGVQRVSWPKGDADDDYQEQWAAGMIRLPEAHTVTRGADITVAVLDTGVDLTHPELVGHLDLVHGKDFVDPGTDPREEGTPSQNPNYGHGTHVAGLVALVAPAAKIMPLRVLDANGDGNIWVLAEALAYAINPDGDPNTAEDGADVINLSLSTTYPTDLLAEIVASVTCEHDDDPGEDDDCLVGPNQHGAVVVVAAGNSGSSTPEYPAAEGVIGSLAVGASTQTDTLASFSNYGSWVHVAAPGEGILSSVPGGYAVWSGTSMATPLVAGEAALVRAMNPSYTAVDVVGHIISKTEGINGPVPKRIDVAAALGVPIVGEYRCEGTVSWLTADNLVVPPWATCTLTGSRIKGTLKVEEGATLNASGLYVKGSIQAKKATSVQISGSIVDGNVEVEEGGSASLQGTQIKGGAKFIKNRKSIFVSNNTIQGDLECKENRYLPTGGDNIIRGSKKDQCSGL